MEGVFYENRLQTAKAQRLKAIRKEIEAKGKIEYNEMRASIVCTYGLSKKNAEHHLEMLKDVGYIIIKDGFVEPVAADSDEKGEE